MDINRNSPNVVLQNFDQLFRTAGDDGVLLSAALEHMKIIAEFLSRDNSEMMTQEEVDKVLLSKLFIDKMPSFVPKKRFTCQVDENSGWMIPLLPFEVFDKESFNEDFRRNLFMKCLEVGDILDCKVLSIHGINCTLKVIHKYGALRILEDLNIMTVLSADRNEMHLLPQQLLKYDLLRVAVREIQAEPEVTIRVTLNDNVTPFKKVTVKLGRISEENLPSYVLKPPDVSHFRSYTDYLNSLLGFHNHLLFQELTSKFGIDPCGMYSFIPQFESLQCPDDFTGEAMLKAVKKNECNKLLDVADKAFNNQNFKQAVRKLNAVLKIDPNCYDAYEMKGRIYAEVEKPKFSKKAMFYFEKAYSINSSNNFIKEQISHALYAVAYKYYKRKEYRMASNFAEKALNLNPSNNNANELLDYLRRKHPEAFLDFENVTLHELQAKKQDIVLELKAFDTTDKKELVKVKVEKC